MEKPVPAGRNPAAHLRQLNDVFVSGLLKKMKSPFA